MPKIYTLLDFMKYPIISYKYSMLMHIVWSGAGKQKYPIFWNLWFLFAFANVIYENIGMVIFLMEPVEPMEPPNSSINYEHSIANNNQEEGQSYLDKFFETCAIICYLVIGVFKLCNLIQNRKRIALLIDEFQEIFPSASLQCNEEQKALSNQVVHYAKKSEFLMKTMFTFVMLAIFYYNLIPLLQTFYQVLSTDRGLTFYTQCNSWYPWKTMGKDPEFIEFLATYLCVFQATFSAVAYIMASEFMFCFFSIQMQMHFELLASALESLDARDADANRQLKNLIGYHKQLIGFSQEINSIFNSAFMANFIISSVNIGMMCLAMVMISFFNGLKYAAGVGFFLVNNYFFFYNASEFTNASNRIAQAAFYSNWYEGDLSYRKTILFFIAQNKNGKEFRIYNYISISMQTYMTILEFSYKVVAFFRTQ